MPRYIALLRGVSPMNLKMPDLKRTLEEAGFTNVKTLLSSGNAAFDAPRAPQKSLERNVEAALTKRFGTSFRTFVRSQDDLKALVASDPFAAFRVPAAAKRVVTFLPAALPDSAELPPFPVAKGNARILAVSGDEVFTVYEPDPKAGPIFMQLLEKAFGKEQTTRTWDTVRKCAVA